MPPGRRRGHGGRGRRQHRRAAPVRRARDGILVGEGTTGRPRTRSSTRRRSRSSRRARATDRRLGGRRGTLPFGSDLEQAPPAALVGRGRRSSCSATRSRAPGAAVATAPDAGRCSRIGKSRLVTEFSGSSTPIRPDHLAAGALPAVRGRISFWALGEMVKAEAGVLESDAAEEAGASSRTPSARSCRASRISVGDRPSAPAARARR